MRLLLIEDDVALGEGIHQALGREGYTVDWLQDGNSALHSLLSETFDLAVLDLGLPRMDGLQVLRRLRESGSNLPVLILTARDATEDRIAGLDAVAQQQHEVGLLDVTNVAGRHLEVVRLGARGRQVPHVHAGAAHLLGGERERIEGRHDLLPPGG